MPAISLLVSTFEQPRHLELVLTALERQTFQDFEVFVCDDGSGPETARVIARFSGQNRFPLFHVWQEHQGFRKCRILNQALAKSKGNLLVFLDGDCVPHRNFLEDHARFHQPGTYSAGRRVELGERFSETLTPERIQAGILDSVSLPLLRSAWLERETEHVQRALRVTAPWLRRWLGMDRIPDLKGCNYSVSRNDLLAINGFDEAYEGYGREDTDVELRLQHLGLRIRSLKGVALQFHVWHPRREFTPANDSLLEEVRKTRRVRCEKGLRQADSAAHP
jgi:glycosyltransferase involved in cell wall biosynthesis